GSLMRIAPVAFYLKMQGFKSPFDSKEALEIVHNISALTHRHLRSKIACGIFVSVLCALVDEPSKKQIDEGLKTAYDYYSARSEYADELKHFDRLFDKNFGNLSRDDIKSSGYVVDTLEAALWCIKTTDDFSAAVLRAVNLGDDADTVASVTGAAAGLLYGYCKELDGFSKQLKRRQFIEQLCEEFYMNNI
ncbi:MAG: ADP-ribosylglycohydrolase family protein, partial [Ruminiclostridium sp.]|nr:ADP-ribosylglycohydrolase family protein [Ruminiclostridium sp.]